MALVLIFLILTGVLFALEFSARSYYRRRFLVPFRSKRIGEYPFSEFVVKLDSPLYYRLKENFRSPMVNINRFGLRGPEPAPDGEKRRLLLMGESGYFGAKLLRERDLWSSVMAHLLLRDGRKEWEILNAGMPGYNSYQYRAWWEQDLVHIRPDILILQMGGNDITQAFVMGSKWRPGIPWPWDFMLKQQRRSSLVNRMLVPYCTYFLWRRRMVAEKRGFDAGDPVFQLERCEETIVENAKAVMEDARNRGIKVCLSNTGIVYDPDMTPENRRRADSIQGNWEESLKTTGVPMIRFFRRWVDGIANDMACPGIDMITPFWNHPRRFEMYLDVVHWNADGHRFTAETLYQEIDKLGWWNL